MSRVDWKPSADIRTLQLRASLLGVVRDHFQSAGVMEVETPVLAHATVTDVHLQSLHTRIAGHGEFYLQTSPEYAMKRLLATGVGDIYQIARVFRDGERGTLPVGQHGAQQVFGLDLRVVGLGRELDGGGDGLAGFFGVLVDVHDARSSF